jgi:spore coat protein U-like protein
VTIRRVFVLLGLLAHGTLAAAACIVTAPNLSFGPYDGLSGAPATTSANIVVSCDESPAATVTILLGPSAVSGGFFPRRMRQDAGSDLLSYNFYADPGASAVWGDGSGGTAIRSDRVLKNKPWTVTIYGRVPPGQDVAAGSYSDLLTITINF